MILTWGLIAALVWILPGAFVYLTKCIIEKVEFEWIAFLSISFLFVPMVVAMTLSDIINRK